MHHRVRAYSKEDRLTSSLLIQQAWDQVYILRRPINLGTIISTFDQGCAFT